MQTPNETSIPTSTAILNADDCPSSDVDTRLDRIESSLQRLEALCFAAIDSQNRSAQTNSQEARAKAESIDPENLDPWARAFAYNEVQSGRERAKGAIQSGIEMAEGLAPAAADAVDRWACEHGDPDQRLHAAMELLEKLSRPERLSTLSKMLEMAERAPDLAGMAAEVVDEQSCQNPNFDERIQQGMALIEKMSRPGVLEQMQGLFDLLEQGQGMAAMLVDAFDAFAAEAQAQGVDLHSAGQNLSQASMGALNLLGGTGQTSPEGQGEGIRFYSPEAIAFVNSTVTAVVAAQKSEPTGLWGLRRALRSSEGRRSLGFLAKFMQVLGKSLKRDDARLSLKDPRAKLAALNKAQRKTR